MNAGKSSDFSGVNLERASAPIAVKKSHPNRLSESK
jgi:hypothetical protein